MTGAREVEQELRAFIEWWDLWRPFCLLMTGQRDASHAVPRSTFAGQRGCPRALRCLLGDNPQYSRKDVSRSISPRS